MQKPTESSENRGFLGNIFGGIMGGSAVNAAEEKVEEQKLPTESENESKDVT